MGTRADFYLGRGEDAVWIASIAWDGYPDGIDKQLLNAESEEAFKHALTAFLEDRNDVTLPEHGWPWPWETSHTTDYAYAFDGGHVWGSCFGHSWFDARKEEPEDDGEGKVVVFPDMSAVKNVRYDEGSGLIVLGAVE